MRRVFWLSVGAAAGYYAARKGQIVVDDARVRGALERRAWLAPADEAALRRACFDALSSLVAGSGLTVAAIDGFFFTNGRARCVELGEPACPGCPIEGACAREAGLFQPIVRTDAY